MTYSLVKAPTNHHHPKMAANPYYKDHAPPLSMRFTHYLAPRPPDSSPTRIRLRSNLLRAWLSTVDLGPAGAPRYPSSIARQNVAPCSNSLINTVSRTV